MCKKDVMNILKERFKENIILLLKFTSKREYAESHGKQFLPDYNVMVKQVSKAFEKERVRFFSGTLLS